MAELVVSIQFYFSWPAKIEEWHTLVYIIFADLPFINNSFMK